MDKLKVLLAKGRIYESVYSLLNDVGISIYLPDRTYFPTTNQKDLAFQVVKPQITSLLLSQNKADVGFSGKDWVYENGVEDKVEEIMDLGFDPVRIVAAIPETKDFDVLLKNPVTIATEYQSLSKKWLEEKKIDGTIFRTWGTSEGFVQDNEDALAQILNLDICIGLIIMVIYLESLLRVQKNFQRSEIQMITSVQLVSI